MTEGVSSSEDVAAARTAEQARLRKQRREAKIKAGGASRLDKITGLGGSIPKGQYISQEYRITAILTPTNRSSLTTNTKRRIHPLEAYCHLGPSRFFRHSCRPRGSRHLSALLFSSGHSSPITRRSLKCVRSTATPDDARL
jgi:hypothetical protein